MVVVKKTGVRGISGKVEENGGKRKKNDETVKAVKDKGKRRSKEKIKKRNEENLREENNGEEGLVDIAQPQRGNSVLGQFGQNEFDLKANIEGGRRKSDLDFMAFVLNICPVPPKYP